MGVKELKEINQELDRVIKKYELEKRLIEKYGLDKTKGWEDLEED